MKFDDSSSQSISSEKISIDILLPNESLSLLKKFRNNIYIEMENKYGCSISKRIEVFFLKFNLF
jgi:hypothetical protein